MLNGDGSSHEIYVRAPSPSGEGGNQLLEHVFAGGLLDVNATEPGEDVPQASHVLLQRLGVDLVGGFGDHRAGTGGSRDGDDWPVG